MTNTNTTNQMTANNEIKTVSDRREEKAWMTGEQAAYKRDMELIRYNKKRADFLNDNPQVGVLNRDGVEVFYHITEGQVVEFTPASVLA